MNRGRMAVLLVPVPEGGIQGPQGMSLEDLSSVLRFAPAQVPQVAPEIRSGSAPTPPTPLGPAAAGTPAAAMTNLTDLKREVARLPRHHPLRVALQGEPDRLPRQELVTKAREWVKYLGWTDSP